MTWFMATLINFAPIHRKYCSYMLYMAKGTIMIAEWFACAPVAHVVVRSRRKFEKKYSKILRIFCHLGLLFCGYRGFVPRKGRTLKMAQPLLMRSRARGDLQTCRKVKVNLSLC